jgi:hypothetical protein
MVVAIQVTSVVAEVDRLQRADLGKQQYDCAPPLNRFEVTKDFDLKVNSMGSLYSNITSGLTTLPDWVP